MKALIVVDMQNDFVRYGGALLVPGAVDIIPFIYKRMHDTPGLVVLTRDIHESNDPSFMDFGGPWPRHCVRGSVGAEFHREVDSARADLIISKSQNSAFLQDGMPTGLHGYLRDNWIDSLDIVGVALDYCVGETALDAAKLGYDVTVYRDSTRAVAPDTGQAMTNRLKMEGVRVV